MNLPFQLHPQIALTRILPSVFDFENIGDVSLSGYVPITFYDGDPLVAGTNKLNTDSISLNNFGVGQVGSAVDIVVNGTGGQFTLLRCNER